MIINKSTKFFTTTLLRRRICIDLRSLSLVIKMYVYIFIYLIDQATTPACSSYDRVIFIIDKDRPRAHQITIGWSGRKHQSSKFTLERMLFPAPSMPHHITGISSNSPLLASFSIHVTTPNTPSSSKSSSSENCLSGRSISSRWGSGNFLYLRTLKVPCTVPTAIEPSYGRLLLSMTSSAPLSQ